MTLEQYQSAQAAKRAGAAAAPARKANEGVDESQWKTKKLERSGDDDVYFAGKVGRCFQPLSVSLQCSLSSGFPGHCQAYQGKGQEGQGDHRAGFEVLGRCSRCSQRSRPRWRIEGWTWCRSWTRCSRSQPRCCQRWCQRRLGGHQRLPVFDEGVNRTQNLNYGPLRAQKNANRPAATG